mgnify:CR=1 FL=1|jgi:hypothetical protein
MHVSGYRYYSPSLGRWTRRDPIEEAGGVNVHVFVRNSPCGRIDAVGRRSTSSSGLYCPTYALVVDDPVARWIWRQFQSMHYRYRWLWRGSRERQLCRLPPIVCHDCCPGKDGGSYSQALHRIKICRSNAEGGVSRGDMRRVMVHELVHAFDACMGRTSDSRPGDHLNYREVFRTEARADFVSCRMAGGTSRDCRIAACTYATEQASLWNFDEANALDGPCQNDDSFWESILRPFPPIIDLWRNVNPPLPPPPGGLRRRGDVR